MSVIGDFTVPAEAFALEHALSAVSEMSVEADRLASHSTMEVFPFLWATGGDFESFHQELKDDPTVTDITIAEETDNESLYRLEWSQGFRDLIDEMVDHHAAISEAQAQGDQWRLKLRFAEAEMVSEFQSHFEETGREFTVHHLAQPAEPRQHEYGLTEEQHEALVTAAREGYFQVPKSCSAEELSGRLDVSANAVSQRLRRGTDALVRNTLTVSDDETAE